MGANGLAAAIEDPDVFTSPARPLLLYLLAILVFAFAVMRNEDSEYFATVFKKLVSAPSHTATRLKAFFSSLQNQSSRKAPQKKTPSKRANPVGKLEMRVDELEKENLELKQMYSELSVELRKAKKKKK